MRNACIQKTKNYDKGNYKLEKKTNTTLWLGEEILE